MVKRPSLTNQMNYYFRVFTSINENRLTSITLAQDQITKKVQCVALDDLEHYHSIK